MSFKDFISENKLVTWIVTSTVQTPKKHFNVEVKASSQKDAAKIGARKMGVKPSEVKAATKFPGDAHLMEEEKLEERYAISQGYKAAEKNINMLVKVLDPNSNLCKGISKGVGDVTGEFKKMQKLMEDVSYWWDEVAMIIDADGLDESKESKER